MPENGVFSLRIWQSRFLCTFAQKEFFSDGPKGFECRPLLHELRAAISFFLLFGTNSSPEKVQHFLVSPNSIKIAPNALFFGAATGSEVLLCWGRCTKISTFLRDPPHPSENGNIHLMDKIADFLHNKLFFLAPRDFLGPRGSTCNTFFGNAPP